MKKFLLPGVITVVILGAVGLYFVNNKPAEEVTQVVHPKDFLQQVSVSGKVVATDSLDLSFEQSGRVTYVRAKVGDRVAAGQLLVSEDSGNLAAQLAEINAGIEVQKARLNQLLAGVSTEDVNVSLSAVTNAKLSVTKAEESVVDANQNLLVTLQAMYTKADDAIRLKADQLFSNPQTQNPKLLFTSLDSSLISEIEAGRLKLETTVFANWQGQLNGLSTESNLVAQTATTRARLNEVKIFLEKIALAVNNPNATYLVNGQTQSVPTTWKSDISTARTNINTALSDLTTAEQSVKTALSNLTLAQGNVTVAESQLALKQAPVRSEDIALVKAQIAQAQASTQNILADMGKRVIRAPFNAIVTEVQAKMGSSLSPNETAISLISTNPLQIESYVPEKNIPLIEVGDETTVTLDAYESSEPLVAKVAAIDPAETIRDGVSTYRVVLQFVSQDSRIKAGMTANLLITTEKKSGVISVPQGLVFVKDGQKTIKIKRNEATVEQVIETGNISSMGEIEITSGLNDGDTILITESK
ncbi:MAG: efflux RND transporter periplasmic adaptor subunit [Patescibacteria group bacterium]